MEPELNLDRLPAHVGVIMDGNGRWAQERNLPRPLGHSQGADAVRRVVRAGRELGLSALTLFAFSAQNWDRPPDEVVHLMELLFRYLHEERAEILDHGIRLKTVGQTHRLPRFVREPLTELIEASSNNQGMVLCLALSYGGREAIVDTVRDLCQRVHEGSLSPQDIDAAHVEASLSGGAALPPLDLLIRTSGERRISNFFLWELAYAELYFSERMWPEFEREDLLEAIRDYASRERRFGKVLDDVTPIEPLEIVTRALLASKDVLQAAPANEDLHDA